MEITLVKALGPGDRDRAWLGVGDAARRVPVHVVHDLPHLVVESLFGMDAGLWGELASGIHGAAARAATARDAKRQKQGRIVSGAASGARTEEWLTPEHRLAKTITNCVANRWGDGPDTPSAVRACVAREAGAAGEALLAQIDDDTIAVATAGVRDLVGRWMALPPGGKLLLTWPLDRRFLGDLQRDR